MPSKPSPQGFIPDYEDEAQEKYSAYQIANELRTAILNRGLRDYLPSVMHLAESYSVSPTTVRRAIKVLSDAHLVVVSNGRRTRITSGPHDALVEVEHEISRIMADLDALRAHIGSLHSMLAPYIQYPEEKTRIPEPFISGDAASASNLQ